MSTKRRLFHFLQTPNIAVVVGDKKLKRIETIDNNNNNNNSNSNNNNSYIIMDYRMTDFVRSGSLELFVLQQVLTHVPGSQVDSSI